MRLVKFSQPFEVACEVALVVGLTLTALGLYVFRADRPIERITLALMGFALPMFWLMTLIRYTRLIAYEDGFVLARWSEGACVGVAIVAVLPRVFPIVCHVLGLSILACFVISGSFDDIRFTLISLGLIVVLITAGTMSARRSLQDREISPHEPMEDMSLNPYESTA